MKRLLPILSMVVLWPLAASWAQLAPPNEMGVRMGHVHVIARDVEAEKKIWVGLGGTPIQIDGTDVIQFPPGLFVFITRGAPAKHEGNVINHVTFFHKPGSGALQRLKAQGVRVVIDAPEEPDDGNVLSTENLRIDNNQGENQDEPVMAGIIRLDLPSAFQREAQAWYGKIFGFRPRGAGVAIPGLARGLDFSVKSGSPHAPQPSKGYTLDHIGFEVTNLEAFCKKLEGMGITFEYPYNRTRHKGFASAELTDPWGASIELTEGLNRF